MTIPQALRLLRKQRGWTQRQLAAELRKAEGTVKHWEIGIREPSAEICEKLGALSTTLDLADYWAEQAGLPPYSGSNLQPQLPPPARDAAIPPTDAQTRMELHAGLDIILDRAPEGLRARIAQDITRGAGQFSSFPVTEAPARATQGKRLLRLLATTLGSGDAEAIQAVTKTLEVFARHVEAHAEAEKPKQSAAAFGRVDPSEQDRAAAPPQAAIESPLEGRLSGKPSRIRVVLKPRAC
jgi:transcriptional regulator with XRE-family HTH domain